ncbi:MAG: hypothetical protein L7V34_00430, partial [Rhodobacteraceae bacterium]|nr:hypothetical protein [Paracoccaceae bacterium]
QDVTLRFSALDQRQTPELFGKVVKVSADAFVDETTRATYYRAEIILNDGQIDRLFRKSIPRGIKPLFTQFFSR